MFIDTKTVFLSLKIVFKRSKKMLFPKTDGTISYKLNKYFADGWNYIDILGIVLFLIGLVLRIVSLFTNETVFIAARYFHDLSSNYITITIVDI